MRLHWRLHLVVALILALSAACTPAQRAASTPKAGRAAAAATGLLVSDIHFDPFHDPAKAKRLDAAPESEWAAILAEPESANAAQDFDALQQKCRARGVDTSYALLRSSLAAMQKQAPGVGFVTVTGDLIAHGYPCRYKAAVGGTNYEVFVAKTITFVTAELRAAFPKVPVYVSLGNNDSGCADYKLDAGGRFLQETAAAMTDGIPPADRAQAAREFAVGGYYSSAMAPLRKARVIVLNDIYWSPKYETCEGVADPTPGDAELAWLTKELADARMAGDGVWVMGHIPVGVNAYATVAKLTDVCADEKPEMFLDSDKLDALLDQYADVVRLALFAHTHMDEMRLITPASGAGAGGGFSGEAAAAHSVAVKLVPSISPVNGNDPSFTVAQVNERSATLEDYRVVVASDKSGTSWSDEYDYAQTYHESDFSATSVARLLDGFRADAKAQQPGSQEYIRHYFKGDAARELTPFWGQYACSLDELTAKGYSACVCAHYK